MSNTKQYLKPDAPGSRARQMIDLSIPVTADNSTASPSLAPATPNSPAPITTSGVAGAPTGPSGPAGGPGNLTPEQSVIKQWQDDLESRLAAIPDVNISERMKGLLEQARSKQIEKKSPAWVSALAAFGNSGQTPTIDARNAEIDRQQREKDNQLLGLQHDIISASIEQDVKKGDFKRALASTQSMQLMKPILDAAERKTAADEWTRKETIKQQGREALVKARGAQARSTLAQRARELSRGLSIDDRLLMIQVSHIARQQEIELQRAATYDPLSQQWTVNPTDYDSIESRGNSDLEAAIERLKAARGNNPAPTVAPAKAAVPITPADRIRAANRK